MPWEKNVIRFSIVTIFMNYIMYTKINTLLNIHTMGLYDHFLLA